MVAQETTNGIEKKFVVAFVKDLVQQVNAQRAPADEKLDASAILKGVAGGLDDPIEDLPELGQRLQNLMATLKGPQ